jgi:hypothetical protein
MKIHPDYRENCGIRQAQRSRDSGHIVSIYDGIAAGLDTSAGRWQTVCEEHGTIISHETFELARWHAPDPLGWCEACAREKGLTL